MKNTFLIFLFLSLKYDASMGHGRLMDPPSRNAMWRLGFSNPINYNDNENYCGGFAVLFNQNGGKCGVCGDNFADPPPRAHETGGRYGNGIIGQRYSSGQDVGIEIDLTTNHGGYFELKLCPKNSPDEIVNQECFDNYPLELAATPGATKFRIPEDSSKKEIFNFPVILPAGVTCNQCVMQWTYKTGNTWGNCGNGTGQIGCGAQETFINCADVQIFDNTGGRPNVPLIFFNATLPRNELPNDLREPKLVVRHTLCVARKPFSVWPNSDEWCQLNCLKYPPNCPKSNCACLNSCEGIGPLRGINGTDVFCHRECLRYPSTCPKDKCECREEPSDPDSKNDEKTDFSSNLTYETVVDY